MSLDELAAHPRRFGRAHPLFIAKSGAQPGMTVGPRHLGGFYSRRKTTAKGERIWKARMRVDGAGTADISIDPGGAGEDCYWLHWVPDRIVRTKLPAGGPGLPRFFFTAHLTGCSVFIETHGDRTYVYHANAQGAGAYPGQQGRDRVFDSGARAVSTHKSDTMRAGFQQVRSTAGGSFTEANPTDYWQSPMLHPPVEMEPKARQHATHHANMARSLLKTRRYVSDAHVSDAYGVVFGVWKHGAWRFYQQSVINIAYRRKGRQRQQFALSVDSCERLH